MTSEQLAAVFGEVCGEYGLGEQLFDSLRESAKELGMAFNEVEGTLILAWIIHHVVTRERPEYSKAAEILDAGLIEAYGLCFGSTVERQKAMEGFASVMANRYAELDCTLEKANSETSPFLTGETILKNTLNNGMPDERLRCASTCFLIAGRIFAIMLAFRELLESYKVKDR